jgi:HD-like signal output (HDOD) protein/ActR/RegA family two-component response regulator
MTTPTPPSIRRILFVDDDPQLLAGLSKALRKHRDRWAMVFVDSGEAALAEVRRATFDVVVSDMRMPAMDGAELLALVRDEDPSTIRMILSGFSDRNAIVRALPVAHQFFNKPCHVSDLSAAIDRACELRTLFGQPALRAVIEAVIAALGAVPPAPGVYHELAAMAGRAELSVETMTAVIQQDAGLHGRVLAAASAPAFGLDHPVRTIADAVGCLGENTVVGLALAAHAMALAGDGPIGELSVTALLHHSLAIAQTARTRLAGEASLDAFIAGLVHDLGRLVIAIARPDADGAIARRMRETGGRRRPAELEILHTSHAVVGAYLLGLWGLPLPIIDAIAHHDDAAAAPTLLLTALRDAHAALPPLAS